MEREVFFKQLLTEYDEKCFTKRNLGIYIDFLRQHHQQAKEDYENWCKKRSGALWSKPFSKFLKGVIQKGFYPNPNKQTKSKLDNWEKNFENWEEGKSDRRITYSLLPDKNGIFYNYPLVIEIASALQRRYRIFNRKFGSWESDDEQSKCKDLSKKIYEINRFLSYYGQDEEHEDYGFYWRDWEDCCAIFTILSCRNGNFYCKLYGEVKKIRDGNRVNYIKEEKKKTFKTLTQIVMNECKINFGEQDDDKLLGEIKEWFCEKDQEGMFSGMYRSALKQSTDGYLDPREENPIRANKGAYIQGMDDFLGQIILGEDVEKKDLEMSLNEVEIDLSSYHRLHRAVIESLGLKEMKQYYDTGKLIAPKPFILRKLVITSELKELERSYHTKGVEEIIDGINECLESAGCMPMVETSQDAISVFDWVVLKCIEFAVKEEKDSQFTYAIFTEFIQSGISKAYEALI